ncbi:MAG: CBS domain-containing protein [Acidimicrobiia bacterium]|nr:CBS domain-containing protein [Acidimicrobiia bacterium]MDH4308601.1 CBS domain-containing protein [Acidimicrobiia bacterium]
MEIRNLIGGTANICGPDVTVAEAARTMVSEGIGSIGVVESGALEGIFTERDVVRALADGADPYESTVSLWMTPDPDMLSPEVDVDDAAEWLLATGYRHLPVVENGSLIGIVSIKDVLWALRDPDRRGG